MCGIVGLVNAGGIDRAVLEPRLDAALRRLARRGPDAEGRWFGATCALGHRRLAVLDLTAEGAQPMSAAPHVIVFNGEIYNFAALRRELEALGHAFRSRSDTEVLLRGWQQWGESVLPRLEGMFAFAIWNEAEEVLHLARDRVGKKPLFYAQHHGGVVFASDLRALEDLTSHRWPLNESAMRLYFALRWIPEAAGSILRGVEKLPPGHVLRYSRGSVETRRWVTSPREVPTVANRAQAADRLLRALDAAVADRMVADVPVGVFLSSGLDSAAVAASAVAQGTRPRTYTVRFPDDRALDESAMAAVVARHLRTDHHEIALTGDEVRDGLHDALEGLDEPFADASCLPTYMLCKAVRREVTVVLSGDGGDEVLGGYRKYSAERLARLWTAMPAGARRLVELPLASNGDEGASGGWRAQIARFLRHAEAPWAERQIGWARLCTEDELDALLVRKAEAPALHRLIEAARPEDARDEITGLLRADQAFSLVGQMLVKVDRMSMAASLEVRSPFLDSRVVDLVNGLPGTWKVGLRRGKLLLRRALASRLPQPVFSVPKRGFDPPLVHWLANDLADLVSWATDPARLAAQGLFRVEVVASWRRRLDAGDVVAARRLWTLVSFQHWAAGRGLFAA